MALSPLVPSVLTVLGGMTSGIPVISGIVSVVSSAIMFSPVVSIFVVPSGIAFFFSRKFIQNAIKIHRSRSHDKLIKKAELEYPKIKEKYELQQGDKLESRENEKDVNTVQNDKGNRNIACTSIDNEFECIDFEKSDENKNESEKSMSDEQNKFPEINSLKNSTNLSNGNENEREKCRNKDGNGF